MIKKFFSVLVNLKNKEDGAVIALASAALVVILGLTALVVDVGALVLEKTRLSNACDAAALAAARELPSSTAAELKALRYLEYNGVSPQEAAVTINEDHNSITVEATRTVNYTFARVLGLSSGTVSARSTAVFGAVSSVTGIVPFGIPEQPLVFGQEYQLKAGSHDDYGPGNYGALALEMPGAKSYRNNLMYGYDGVISVGDWVETEPGNMSGPTEEGVKYRISQCPHTPRCTIDNYHRDCPMVMIVPIYDPTVLNGRDKVHIVGFGAFLLKGVEGQGKKSCVTGYFLEMNPPEGLNYTIDPNQTDYGLHGTKLIE